MRVRISRRVETGIVAASMAAAAVGAALAGLHPTGIAVVDAAWSGAFAAGVVLAATRARRWSWLLLTGVAAVMASGPVWAGLAVAALIAAVVASVVDVRGPITGAVVAAAAVQSVLRLTDFGVDRLSGLAAAGACGVVAVSGYGLARRRTRRITRRSLLAAGLAAAGAALLAGAALNDARVQADRGEELSQAALRAVQAGDTAQAKEKLDQATEAFTHAHEGVASAWTAPARLVPGLALQIRAADEVAATGADIARTASVTVSSADYRAVRLEGGRIDLPRLAGMAAPLEGAVAALEAGAVRAAGIDTTWLVPWVADGASRLGGQIDRVLPPTRLALSAAREVPGLLGGDGPRHYLVLFAQPAEARGLGGFVGGFGELAAVDGKIELVRSGPIEELSEHAGRNARTLAGPPEFLERYGRFRPQRFLQNVTASPDLPTVRRVFQELYPQAGGGPIDGVIYADPAGLAALLELTGPVKVTGLDDRLTAANAEDFLLRGQYELVTDSSARDRMLNHVGKATFDALLKAKTPAPEKLGRALGPAVQGGHLLMSVDDEGGQRFLESIGAGLGFPAPAGEDWFSARVFNGNGNKIDAYLGRTTTYEATVDPATGQVTATATVRLDNTAPGSGLPDRVIGNENGEAPGTNRLYLSLHTPLALDRAEIDGAPGAVEPQHEFGGNVYSLPVVLPPGGSTTVVVHLSGRVAGNGRYRVTVSSQPLARPEALTVTIRAGSGWRLLDAAGQTVEGGVLTDRGPSSGTTRRVDAGFVQP